MDRTIRRIVTITITETWTIVWATTNEPEQQATTVQHKSYTQEESDEALKNPLAAGKPGDAPTPPAIGGRIPKIHRRRNAGS
jgi:hypothetical protein